jgi:hypothetical protein
MFENRFYIPRVAAVDTPRQLLERRDARQTRNLLTRVADHGLIRRGVSNPAESR